jgi:hypothetical protein
MNLVEFLTARLDEDEAIALGVSDGPRKPEGWVAQQWPYGTAPRDWAVDCPFGAVVVDSAFRGSAEHIARHDPARVLAEVVAKRRILALHEPELDRVQWRRDETCYRCSRCTGGGREYEQVHGVMLTELSVWPCLTVMLLAVPYAAHPDYDPAWRLT